MYFIKILKNITLLQLVFSSLILADINISGNFSIKKGEVAELMATGNCTDTDAVKNFQWTVKEKIDDGVFSTEPIFYFYPAQEWTESKYHVDVALYCNGVKELQKEAVVTIESNQHKKLTVEKPLTPPNCKGELIQSGLDLNDNNILEADEVTYSYENYTDGEPLTREILLTMIKNKKDITSVNICKIRDMNFLFQEDTFFNQDITGWDTSNVTNMKDMFFRARVFNKNIGLWDISKVETMENMFEESILPLATYDAILNGWSSQENIKHNISFSGGHSQYTQEGQDAREKLINEFGWNIIDGGKIDVTFENNDSCTYRTATNSCIKLKMDNPHYSLYLKHDNNPMLRIEHIQYREYHNKIINIKFLPFSDGSYLIFWVPYSQMRDNIFHYIGFNSDGEVTIPKKRLISLGHGGYKPDITMLKNENFIFDWCAGGDERRIGLFNHSGDKINYFSHNQFNFISCMGKHAIITPLDDGGFNYRYKDYNQTFDSEGNPIN